MDGTESIMSGDSLTGHKTYNDDNDTVELCYYVEMCCNGMFGCGNNGLISPPNEHRTWDILMCDVGKSLPPLSSFASLALLLLLL